MGKKKIVWLKIEPTTLDLYFQIGAFDLSSLNHDKSYYVRLKMVSKMNQPITGYSKV